MSTGRGSLRVAAFQCALGGAGQPERLAALRGAIDAAGDERPDLIVAPELFMSGYNARGRSLVWPNRWTALCNSGCRARRAPPAPPFFTVIPSATAGAYNAAACFSPTAPCSPITASSSSRRSFELDRFEPGDGVTFFTLAGLSFAVLVCHDAEFPEAARHAARAGAHCLLVPTALRDVWGVVAHKMMPTRAFENGVYVVCCN